MVLALCAAGATAAPAATATTERLVVRLKPGSAQPAGAGAVPDAARQLSSAAGVPLRLHRTLSTGAQVYRLERPVPLAQARALAWRLKADPQVASAEPDVRVQTQALPDDPGFASQWSLKAVDAANAGGANLVSAWQKGTGNGVTVAVVDTGILPSAELAGRVLPGYDLIGDDATSGDGSAGRDADATDPGDSCAIKNPDGTVVSRTPSTWHGLRVASQLAAAAGNGYGIAGAAPGVTVQPVRALGKCGGWMSDIADAVAWAAGLKLEGVPRNTVLPRVINLSLGGDAACTAFMQEAIDAANARNIVVVAAAGNGGSNRLLAPANCSGVIVVGAHTRSGDLAAYSNFGPTVTLTAPGGGACAVQGSGCRSDLTLAIGNRGSEGAAAEDPAMPFSGTSSAAPHVSATVAMILAAHPEFGYREVKSILERSARKAPAGTWCSEKAGFCGAGMLDAGAALALADSAVQTPYVDVEPVPGVLRRGALLPINAVAVGATDFVWSWRQLSGPPAALLATDGPDVQAQMPSDASGTVVFEAVAVSASRPEQRATARVAVDVNEPPVIQGGALTAQAGRAMAVPLGASDPEGGVLEYSYVGSTVPGLEIVDGELRWREPAAGTYAFQVVAVDDEGSTSGANFTLTVTAQSSAPPADAAAGGGGGGATGEAWLLGLLLAAALLRRRRVPAMAVASRDAPRCPR